ncbi:transient receptor potential cation channel subfamily M member-like 2 isoform X2 [Babylonia areolata]
MEDAHEMMARVHPNRMESSEGMTPRTQSVVSLQYNEQAQLAEGNLVGGASPSQFVSSNEGEEAQWIKNNIKCRECRCFLPVENDSSDDDVTDKKCQCGHRRSEHRNPTEAETNGRLLSLDSEWDHKKHSSPIPTNAFGEIEFVGYGGKVAKYVRVDTETSMSMMKTLLMDKWRIERPNLLISVTGGAKNFKMRARLKDAFRRGLMRAALSTSAWIVTGGTNTGVMKHVGEAVRDYGLTAEGRVICIGFAPWGCVQNRNVLECGSMEERGKWPAEYRILEKQKPKQSFLDPNHSHFILVDNGSQHKFATEIEFRAHLEKEISLMTTNTGGRDAVPVPVCLLVLEGGPGTLKTVMNAVQNNTPAIVIKGSGKCADVLAYAAQNVTETEVESKDKDGKTYTETSVSIEEKLKADIKQMVEEVFGPKNSVQHANWVEQCIQKPHLISVFELESAGGVDVAILKALLKANQDQVMDQLKLALAWNRIDIAKSEIFTDERPWPTGALDEMMMSAIQLNRVDFVDLFLDNGVSLRGFLTVRRLLKLYNEIPRNCLLHSLLAKVRSNQRKRFSLEDVGFLLQVLLGDYYEPEYLEETFCSLDVDCILGETDAEATPMTPSGEDACDGESGELRGDSILPRPAQDLFLWAVLMNQQDLAKLFWREGNESTAAALVANSLLKAMKNYTKDADIMHRLQKNADEFEDLGIGVINSCYSHDEQKAQDVLVRELNNWGKATCVLIAVQADNKRFISQTACQTLLNSIWMGKMSQDNGLITRLIPSMLIFPLILFIIKFQDEERAPSDNIVPRTAKAMDNRPPLKREPTQAILTREATQATLSGVEMEKKPKGLSSCEKLRLFYTSPVIIFILNCISYLVFLGLYSYILVVQLSSEFHVLEGILIAWVFTIFVEELRQLVTNYAHSISSKVTTYVTDSWNLLDIITIGLFVVGMVLRFIPNDTSFEWARVVLAINLVSFFFRILHIFSVNKELGPKLVMIRRMIRDLMWFVVILMVFIGAYAIASEAILYPQTELSWKLLYHLPRKAYWQIYGELFLEEIEGSDNSCTTDPALYSGYNVQRCPSDIGKYLVPVLMGVYVLMTNVLLLNLLIAMFSYTFQKIQENTDVHWYYQRFNLVLEYYERPWLPPPFTLFIHVFMVVSWCVRGCSSRPLSSDIRKRYSNAQDEKKLVQWENIIADTYLTKVEAQEAYSMDGRIKGMMHKLELIQTKVDDFVDNQGHGSGAAASSAGHGADTSKTAAVPAPMPSLPVSPKQAPVKQIIQMPPQLDHRLSFLEEQMASTFRALNWIMQAMEANDMRGTVTPPQLGSPIKDKDKEKKEERKLRSQLKKQVSKQLEKRLDLHVVSRSPVYPMSFVGRFPVPDEKVPWEVEFEEYDPVSYTSQTILAGPSYADKIDLMALSPKERTGLIPFNNMDSKNKVSRISFEGQYKVKDGLPLNPNGRTGLEGRGLLGRWGPNMAGDPIVTRWKCDEKGQRILVDKKPVLEFIAVKREDNKMWAIPGTAFREPASEEAILLPGEEPWDLLTKYFTTEVLGSQMDDPDFKADIKHKMELLSQKGVKLYQGYADDARNTDNAWLETCVVNYHDDTGDILQQFDLRAGVGTLAVSWLTVSSKIALHGSHLYFIKLVAEKHGAAF